MEILRAAVGICAIVCLVFYVLAARWQRVLRQQSWMIRKLADRVKAIEDFSDPQFRQRLGVSSPMPLERVFTFSFRLNERFWRGTLGLRDNDWEFVQRFGSVVGSVKLERWRSHTVATITEALPSSAAAQWQRRTLDFYPDDAKENAAHSLWELPLGLPNASAERPSSLELVMTRGVIELRGHFEPSDKVKQTNGHPNDGEVTFFRVPLDPGRLAEFRSQEPVEEAEDSARNGSASEVVAASWQAFYATSDERIGFAWQLWLRDLTRKADWDRWRILDHEEVRAAR